MNEDLVVKWRGRWGKRKGGGDYATRFLRPKAVKWVLTAAFTSLHLAPSQASSGGWGGTSSATGAGGAWPSAPPAAPPNRAQGTPVHPHTDGDQVYHDPDVYNKAPPEGERFNADGDRFDPYSAHQRQQAQQQHYTYAPEPTHWTEQEYHTLSHQQQHQQQRVQQQLPTDPPHHEQQYPPPPNYGGGGYTGQPLHLGTKWRNMVSRVKDAVRPGQPPPPNTGQNGEHFQGGYSGRWDGGRGQGGRFYPPGSSWVGGANQHTGYAPPPQVHGGYTPPNTNSGYGDHMQQQQEKEEVPHSEARTPGYDGYTPGGGGDAGHIENYQGQEHHAGPPAEFFNPTGSSLSPRYQAQQHQAPGLNGSGEADGSSNGHRYKTENVGGYGGISTGGPSAGLVDVTVSEGRHGAVGGGLQPEEQSLNPEVSPSATGQGWSTHVADPTPHETPSAASGENGQGSQLPLPPTDPSWSPPDGQNNGLPNDIPTTLPSGPSDDDSFAVTKSSGCHMDKSKPAAAIGSFGVQSGSTSASSTSTSLHHSSRSYDALDTMPSSADHGMERVDWGEEAEENEEGGEVKSESGETVVVPGSEERLELEREEEALIRELERMDSSIENGDNPLEVGDSGIKVSSSPPSSTPSEDQEMIDQAQLDDIFDSIIRDDVDVDFYADNIDVTDVGDEGYKSVTNDRPPNALPMEAVAVEFLPGEDRGLVDEGEADAARDQLAEPSTAAQSADHPRGLVDRDHGSYSRNANEGATAAAAGGDNKGAAARESVESSSSPSLSATAEAAEATIIPEAETVAESGSLWGNPRRWESLPPQPVVDVSDSDEEVQELRCEDLHDQDEDEDDAAAGGVPLDPIELPPSAATDEIWNDQHLQDQLDAYWEQSRRGGAAAAVQSAGVQQLSTYEGGEPRVQPTYGPGDWVGRNGGAALQPEPLPGGIADGVAQTAGWAVAPRLFQGGNQAPINIYGNVHVHLQQGGAQQPSPSSEPSARERYFSQGETSWSGNDRGGR